MLVAGLLASQQSQVGVAGDGNLQTVEATLSMYLNALESGPKNYWQRISDIKRFVSQEENNQKVSELLSAKAGDEKIFESVLRSRGLFAPNSKETVSAVSALFQSEEKSFHMVHFNEIGQFSWAQDWLIEEKIKTRRTLEGDIAIQVSSWHFDSKGGPGPSPWHAIDEELLNPLKVFRSLVKLRVENSSWLSIVQGRCEINFPLPVESMSMKEMRSIQQLSVPTYIYSCGGKIRMELFGSQERGFNFIITYWIGDKLMKSIGFHQIGVNDNPFLKKETKLFGATDLSYREWLESYEVIDSNLIHLNLEYLSKRFLGLNMRDVRRWPELDLTIPFDGEYLSEEELDKILEENRGG